MGCYKVNLDGAVFEEARRSGMGVLIRDENGLPIAALSSSGRHVGGKEVEAYALVWALRFSLEVGTRTITVEGDSLRAIQSPEEDFSRIGYIIKKDWLYHQQRRSYSKDA